MRFCVRLWAPVLVAALSASCGSSSPGATGSHAASAPKVPAAQASKVDTLLRAAWEKEGIVPAAPADDATFLRRATIDLWGMLPTPAEMDAFTTDAAQDKRARLIDRMLADARFAERFAVVWTDILLGEAGPKEKVDRAAFRSWLHKRMVERAPWDAIVREIIAGSGKSSPGGSIKDRTIASHAPFAEPQDPDVQGHVNYLLQFGNGVENLTGKTSRAFLGIQIQCAQCHDHKTEAWTMEQFRGLAAAFIKTRAVPVEAREKGELRVVEIQDAPRPKLGPKATDSMRAIAKTPPRALDGTSLDAEARRSALADWITAKDNPTFARAFVNRTWAALLGTGFVEPVDDFRPGNKPVMPELLDTLAETFSKTNNDVRALYRAICLSDAYQRSAGPAGRLWSTFAMRPLPAVVLFDILVATAGLGPIVEEALGERAELARARTRQQFVMVLDVDEEAGTHEFEGGILHALLLSNGVVSRVAGRAVEGGALLEILRAPGDDNAKIDKLYARTLSRHPSRDELSAWKRFLDDAPSASESDVPVPQRKGDPLGRLDKRLGSQARSTRERAYEDLFWALLNSSEMALQH